MRAFSVSTEFYANALSSYVPYTVRRASQISPTVAYAFTASMMKGIVFTGEMLPFSPALGSCAAACFSASRARWTAVLSRRSRNDFNFRVCASATFSPM